MKRKPRRAPDKDDIAEDWCFCCKDGGLLFVCDHKQCSKSYHPACVGKDDSFLESGNRWTCAWHSCDSCQRTSDFQCFCCPTAVCRRCIKTSEFVHVRGKKGFCSHCLKLTLLVEEKKEVDSDGEQIDFEDRETYEGLFREYWEIVKGGEGLSLENLIDARMKMCKDTRSDSSSEELDFDEEDQFTSDSDDDTDDSVEARSPKPKRKRSSRPKTKSKEKIESNKIEFFGWGSKSLLRFLEAIGKDTTAKLSQHEVTSIINEYIKENKLLTSDKRKVVCDVWLQSVFKWKKVNKDRIYDLLESHFVDNQEDSGEDEELEYTSEDMDDDILVDCKTSAEKRSHKKEKTVNVRQFYFASIVPENIKLVYLRRSLVLKLLQQPETSQSKVIGSFVRVKSEYKGCFRKNFYQLIQVKGVSSYFIGGSNQDVFLKVSDTLEEINISSLSDDDFSEEECLDLKKKMKDGLVKKLTLDWLEQKARSLHEDITKHWIPRELALLQNRIDKANEKGWRKELYEYLERRQLLQNPMEQSRMLQKLPTAVPDEEEPWPIHEDIMDNDEGDNGSSKSTLMNSSKTSCVNHKDNNKSSSDVSVVNKNTSNESALGGSPNVENKIVQELNVDNATEDVSVVNKNASNKSVAVGSLNVGGKIVQEIDADKAPQDVSVSEKSTSDEGAAIGSPNTGDEIVQEFNVDNAAEGRRDSDRRDTIITYSRRGTISLPK